MNSDYETLEFADSELWRKWVDAHHADTNGVWLRIYKKASGIQTVSYGEALDVALCYGWIDGQIKKYDEVSYIQKFTPRRKLSLWSKRNIEYIGRLQEAGRMMPPGIAEVERAKADGRWDAAYDKPSDMQTPEDFLAELQHHPTATKAFETLNKSGRYSIAWKLQTAKTDETRRRRMIKIIEELNNDQKTS